jgi:hypothetical protein
MTRSGKEAAAACGRCLSLKKPWLSLNPHTGWIKYWPTGNIANTPSFGQYKLRPKLDIFIDFWLTNLAYIPVKPSFLTSLYSIKILLLKWFNMFIANYKPYATLLMNIVRGQMHAGGQ